MVEKEKTNSGDTTVIFFLLVFLVVYAMGFRFEMVSFALILGIFILAYVNHQGRVSKIVRDAVVLIYSISYSWLSYKEIYVGVIFFVFWYVFTRLVAEREKGNAVMPWEKESPYAPPTKKKKPKQS